MQPFIGAADGSAVAGTDAQVERSTQRSSGKPQEQHGNDRRVCVHSAL